MAKPIIIDTNVILRYLLKDNQDFYSQSENLFKRALTGEITIMIIQSVVAETIYVLMKLYKINKEYIVDILLKLFTSKGIKVQDNNYTILALEIFKEKNLDFVDCLICAYGKKYKAFSFDTKLNKCIEGKL